MRFLDEEYDGVIIQLPSAFIKMNNLEDVLKRFKEELENTSKFSLLLPDYENSLYELENYPDKKAILNLKKEQQKKREEDRNKLLDKYVAKIYLPYVWKEHNFNSFQEIQNLYFKNRTFEKIDELLFPTNKNGKMQKKPCVSVLNEINDLFWQEVKEDDIDTYYEFVKRNPRYFPAYHLPKETYNIAWKLNEKPFYISRQKYYDEVLTFRCQTIYVHWYTDRQSYYEFSVDKKTGRINSGRGEVNINDYYFKGNLLIKKDNV